MQIRLRALRSLAVIGGSRGRQPGKFLQLNVRPDQVEHRSNPSRRTRLSARSSEAQPLNQTQWVAPAARRDGT